MKKSQYIPEESLERIKLIMGYDVSKTLNENRQVIFEQTNVEQLVRNFKNNQRNRFGRAKGLLSTLNNIPDNKTFIEFFNGVNSETGKSLGRHINELLRSSDANIANDISNLLKTKFGITVKSDGIVNDVFVKTFQFPSNEDRSSWGLQPSESESSPSTEKKEPLAKEPEQQQIPTTYEDVINGKGVLKMGMRGDAVNQLQQMLVELGYNLGTTGVSKNGVDGGFGKLTDTAIRQFQNSNRPLTVDGIVGKNTSQVILQKWGEVKRAGQLRQRREQEGAKTPVSVPNRDISQVNVQIPTPSI
jgi:hypothetical protein